MNELKEKLNEIIKTIDDLYLNTSVLEASEEAELANLGIDSLGKINLFYGIIDYFEVDRDESEAANWKTLKDVLTYIEKL